MTKWCSVCRFFPSSPNFDLCAKCLHLGLQPELDYDGVFRDANGDVVTYPRWPAIEESELWARRGRSVETVGYL